MGAFSSSLSCRACNARWHEVRAWNMSSTTSLTPSSPAPRRHHASHRVAPSLRIVNCLHSYVSHQSPPLHLVNRLRASTCLGLFNNVSRLDLIHRKEQKRPIHLGIFLKITDTNRTVIPTPGLLAPATASLPQHRQVLEILNG
uniref:Uncharacterized protein n=1 Tax=Oryza barthii TaxID=65489 RepID=A0A0D3F4N6_9ORYZ